MDVEAPQSELREDGQTFAEMFEESLTRQDAVREGEIVKGRVLEVGKESVLIDIGYKSEAAVSIRPPRKTRFRPQRAVRDVAVRAPNR